MKKSNLILSDFPSIKRKKVTVTFDEPAVTSDAGVLLLRQTDERLNLIATLARMIQDERQAGKVDHALVEMLRQRVFQITCGYPDANDADHLRSDPAFKTAVGRDPQTDPDLASQPTLSRLENTVTRRDLLRVFYFFIDQFMASYAVPPAQIILDMDPTADTVYGHQQLALFNAYEDEYCFMPFHVYEGKSGKFITAILRPGKTPTAEEILAVLKRIVRRLRRAWPNVRILFRGDSHHTKPDVMDWMEANRVDFITGLALNKKLDRRVAGVVKEARRTWRQTGMAVRRYTELRYAAGTWQRKRRVICRVLVSDKGVDTRYVVTSLAAGTPQKRYDKTYCGRGKMELMIKDHKVGLASDRTSCHRKEANQFRLFLHSAAYVLLHALRLGLRGTALAQAQFDTLRLALLKIGGRLRVMSHQLRFHLPASCPHQELFLCLATNST